MASATIWTVLRGEGEGWGIWGRLLMDVYARGQSGLEKKLVCSFKLAANVLRGCVKKFLYYAEKESGG